MCLVSSWSCLCEIYWSLVSSGAWTIYILIAYLGASYIRFSGIYYIYIRLGLPHGQGTISWRKWNILNVKRHLWWLRCIHKMLRISPQDVSSIDSLYLWGHDPVSTLAQVRLVCCLTAQSHQLNQYWLIIKVFSSIHLGTIFPKTSSMVCFGDYTFNIKLLPDLSVASELRK